MASLRTFTRISSKKVWVRTVKGVGAIGLGLALTSGVIHGCYVLFQYIAVLTGVLDIHAVGTITCSNVPIVVGIGLVALAVTILTTRLCTRCTGATSREARSPFW